MFRTLTKVPAAQSRSRHPTTFLPETTAIDLIRPSGNSEIHAEMTTQEAADFLNISRPYFIGMQEAGHIPDHKAGTHRRAKFRDVRATRKA